MGSLIDVGVLHRISLRSHQEPDDVLDVDSGRLARLKDSLCNSRRKGARIAARMT